jgi:hypothetical protein
MIEPGVYVLEGSFQAGTGHTSKEKQTHRSLWATCAVSDEMVTLMLLDEKGAPTGVTETISIVKLKNTYRYQSLSPETWALLQGRIEALYRSRTRSPKAPAPAPSAEPRAAPAPETQPEKPKKKAPASDDPFDTTSWWEKPRK